MVNCVYAGLSPSPSLSLCVWMWVCLCVGMGVGADEKRGTICSWHDRRNACTCPTRHSQSLRIHTKRRHCRHYTASTATALKPPKPYRPGKRPPCVHAANALQGCCYYVDLHRTQRQGE